MPLAQTQTTKIDEMIDDNAKKADIINELVGNGADVREVEEYLKENKTLQGRLNTITRRAGDILTAGTEQERKAIVKEIESLSKKSIKTLQKKAGQ